MRGLVFALPVSILLWALLILGGLFLASEASSAPLTPTCELRSSVHQSEHGGLAADSAYHVSHGELPTCEGADPEHRRDDHEDNDKSRYCRKHIWC